MGADQRRREAIELAYQITTLTQIPEDLLADLLKIDYIRVLEVFVVLRQSPNEVKAPANFIRSALRQGWKPGKNSTPTIKAKNSNGPGQAPSRYESFYELYGG